LLAGKGTECGWQKEACSVEVVRWRGRGGGSCRQGRHVQRGGSELCACCVTGGSKAVAVRQDRHVCRVEGRRQVGTCRRGGGILQNNPVQQQRIQNKPRCAAKWWRGRTARTVQEAQSYAAVGSSSVTACAANAGVAKIRVTRNCRW